MLPLRDAVPTRRRAVLTLVLIAANVAVFFLVQPSSDEIGESTRFSYETAAIPCELTTGETLTAGEIVATVQGVEGNLCDADRGGRALFPDKNLPLSVVWSMFLHGGLAHLGGNMLFLWIFGNNIEDRLGRVRYLAFYLVAGAVATVAHVALQPDSTIPVVGASGAIAGVMGAYLVWYPRAPILTLVAFFPVVVAARWLLLFWFASQFFVNPNEGIAWAAHVGGFVFGVLVGLLLRGRRRPVVPSWS